MIKENGLYYGSSLLLIVFSQCKSYANENKCITINALVKDIFGAVTKAHYLRVRGSMNTLERSGVFIKTIHITERKTVQYQYTLNPQNTHVNV